MGVWDWLSRSSRSNEAERAAEPLHLARGRGFTCDVVGEASYQSAFNSICGGKCEEGHDLRCTAQLCFQEDNPHDPNAVVVLIGGTVVGYLPRAIAAEMRSSILRLNPHEWPVTCDAQIVGWSRDEDDEGHYGVKLSLSNPLTLAK